MELDKVYKIVFTEFIPKTPDFLSCHVPEAAQVTLNLLA